MEKEAPLIPMEDFFRNPEKSSFRISPDGNHIAYMKPWETRMNVFVLDIGNSDEKTYFIKSQQTSNFNLQDCSTS